MLVAAAELLPGGAAACGDTVRVVYYSGNRWLTFEGCVVSVVVVVRRGSMMRTKNHCCTCQLYIVQII